MLKVALVVPEPKAKLIETVPPLNLGYLASYLRKFRSDVEIRIVDGLAGQDVKSELLVFNPNIIGITATTSQAPDAYELADWIKQMRPNVLVVMGGVHASCLPEEALRHVDCVVIGEGEKALVRIVNQYELRNTIPKIIHGEYMRNLDELPLPAYDLINVEKYLKHGPWPPFGLENPITIGIVTSRGCPFSCPFCLNSFRDAPVRYFSAKRIVDEIEFCINRYHINSVFFHDDEFVMNKHRLLEFKKLLVQRGLLGKFVWGCQSRVQSLDVETLRLMKSMSCVFVLCGMESHSPRILKFLKNSTTRIEDNDLAVENAKKVGMAIMGSFIFGSPTETYEEMQETFHWIENEHSLLLAAINTLIPFPKTTLWDICKKKGLLPKIIDYRKLTTTTMPRETYIICQTMPNETFAGLMVDKARVTWILCRIRQIHFSKEKKLRKFLKLSKAPTWWYVLLRHPFKMIHAFSQDIMVS